MEHFFCLIEVCRLYLTPFLYIRNLTNLRRLSRCRVYYASYNHPCIFVLQLLDIVLREETLINVVRSVTRNGRSIILTALLALILVYLFSIVGFLFLKDDFLVDAEPRMPRIVSPGRHGIPYIVFRTLRTLNLFDQYLPLLIGFVSGLSKQLTKEMTFLNNES